jgi:hypothetical protein
VDVIGALAAKSSQVSREEASGLAVSVVRLEVEIRELCVALVSFIDAHVLPRLRRDRTRVQALITYVNLSRHFAPPV